MGETTKPQVVRGQSSWGALWVSVLVAVASVSVFIVADQWLSIGHNADTIRLPTVDISPLFDNRATSHQLHRVAQQLLQAASNTGCLFVIGHGFNHTQQTATLAAAHELMHGVSPSTRRSLAVQPGKLVRGYVSLGGESGAADLVEVKEGFSYGYEWPMHKPPMSVLQGPNVWPTPEDGLSAASRKHLQHAFNAMVNVSNAITRAVALAIGQDPAEMSQLCSQGDSISIMRVFRYMARGGDVYNSMCGGGDGERECTGSSPHTDWGYLTLILQGQDPSEQQSLELWDAQRNKWRRVAPPSERNRNALVMNAGDFLALLSQGRFKSPRHRVTLTPSERISLVFFGYPNADASLDALAGGEGKQQGDQQQDLSLFETQDEQSDGKSVLDTSLTFGEYIAKKWEQVARG